MQEQITFGKFQGWTPLELAKAGEVGRGYLSWGAEYLKSPKWRRAFADALHADIEPNPHLMARAMCKDTGNLSYEEALSLAEDEITQQAEINELLQVVENRQASLLALWADVMSITSEKLRGLAHRYEFSDWDQLPPSSFSSPEMYYNFLSFMQAWTQTYE